MGGVYVFITVTILYSYLTSVIFVVHADTPAGSDTRPIIVGVIVAIAIIGLGIRFFTRRGR